MRWKKADEEKKRVSYYPFGMLHNSPNHLVNGRKHNYGFNGKEENYLGSQLLDLDFGARNYDPALGRWMNIDPLSELMTRHSPYNYAFNNPLRFIDPDGMSPNDIVIDGDQEFRDRAFADLQALTDDKLQIDDNGKVTIEESSCSEGCENGDNLVAELINSDSITTIVKTDGANETVTRTEDGAVTTGEGDSTILFNPDKTSGGIDVAGSKNRPAEIGLAHELGHSRDIANDTEPKGQSNFVTPFGDLPEGERFEPNSTIYNTLQILSNREAKIRNQVENPIRKERGLKARKMTTKKQFRYDSKF